MMEARPEFFAPLGDRLSQGDILRSVPWGLVDAPITVFRPDDRSKPIASFGPVIVLWHDCQIDKFLEQNKPLEKWFTGVAPLLPLDRLDSKSAQFVIEGRRRAFFFVPAYPAIGLNDSMYVDLRHIWPIKQALLTERIGTLSPAAREALYAHLFMFLTQREILNELKCGKCGNVIQTRDAFSAENDA